LEREWRYCETCGRYRTCNENGICWECDEISREERIRESIEDIKKKVEKLESYWNEM
jgi:hypothetical protein